MNLQGTQRRSGRMDDILSMASEMEAATEAEAAVIGADLQLWEALKKTRLGSILSELMDPVIAHLEAVITAPVSSGRFAGLALDVVDRMKAEATGELRAWRTIRDRPGELKRRLEEIRKAQEDLAKVAKGEGGEKVQDFS